MGEIFFVYIKENEMRKKKINLLMGYTLEKNEAINSRTCKTDGRK